MCVGRGLPEQTGARRPSKIPRVLAENVRSLTSTLRLVRARPFRRQFAMVRWHGRRGNEIEDFCELLGNPLTPLRLARTRLDDAMNLWAAKLGCGRGAGRGRG